jgi:hypothetical protein
LNRKYDLQNLIAVLLSGHKMSLETVVTRAGLNFEWISQSLQFNAETIYRFRMDNNSENTCDYLSEPVLKHRGTLVYSYTDSTDFSNTDAERRMELWFLDDLTPVVISAVEFTDADNNYTAVYRQVRTRNLDEIPKEINIVPSKFAAALQALSDAFRAVPIPFQEL